MLFRSFKAKHIDREEYLIHLTRYVHLNPFDIFGPETQGSIKKIVEYPWSSLRFYLDGSKRSLVGLEKETLSGYCKTADDFHKFTFSDSQLFSEELELLKLDSPYQASYQGEA